MFLNERFLKMFYRHFDTSQTVYSKFKFEKGLLKILITLKIDATECEIEVIIEF